MLGCSLLPDSDILIPHVAALKTAGPAATTGPAFSRLLIIRRQDMDGINQAA